MNEQLATILGFVNAAWRRRWWAVGVAWAFCLVAWVVIILMPDIYQANARVYVDMRTATKAVIRGLSVDDDLGGQLSLVREALLSRPQLEAVARKTDLDAGVRTPGDMDNVVDRLRSKINVEMAIAQGQEGAQQKNAVYSISYEDSDRTKSIKVVQTLLDNFVEGTLSGGRSGADTAQNFLRSQIAEYEKRLGEAESRLAEFKKRNVGVVPGERGDYFARLDKEMSDKQAAETNLAVALSRREALRQQIANANPYVPGTSGSTGARVGGIAPTTDVSVRLQQAEARMEELLQRFTDKHPEVIALQQTIDELRAREAKELAELARGGPGTGAIRSLASNPVYQSIQLQLNQAEVDIASLRGQVTQHLREISNLRKVVDTAPQVEQELAQLNRDYGVTKSQYESLVQRLEQSKVSDDAAQTGIMKFDVIEPPRASASPVRPVRGRLIMMTLLGGLGFGLAVALLPFFLSPTFDATTTLAKATGLRVIGAISRLHDADENRRARVDAMRVAVAAACLAAVCVLFLFAGEGAGRMLRQLIG